MVLCRTGNNHSDISPISLPLFLPWVEPKLQTGVGCQAELQPKSSAFWPLNLASRPYWGRFLALAVFTKYDELLIKVELRSPFPKSMVRVSMRVDHGRDAAGGQVQPPKFRVRGNANANCPLRFLLWYKRERCGLKNTPKSVFGRGSAPDPGDHDAPPHTLVGWRGNTRPHTPPRSAPTHLRRSPCVPQNSSQIYACAYPRVMSLSACSQMTIRLSHLAYQLCKNWIFSCYSCLDEQCQSATEYSI